MTNPTAPDTTTSRAATGDPAPTPWATTRTVPYAAPADSLPVPATAPALNPPTWSGRKTAVAAALAIGISSMGAVGAAAALPSGSASQSGPGQFRQGGFGRGSQSQQGPPGGQNIQGLPGGQSQQAPVPRGQGTP